MATYDHSSSSLNESSTTKYRDGGSRARGESNRRTPSRSTPPACSWPAPHLLPLLFHPRHSQQLPCQPPPGRRGRRVPPAHTRDFGCAPPSSLRPPSCLTDAAHAMSLLRTTLAVASVSRAAAAAGRSVAPATGSAGARAYHANVIDHYDNPRYVCMRVGRIMGCGVEWGHAPPCAAGEVRPVVRFSFFFFFCGAGWARPTAMGGNGLP